jgi:CBS domain-containing protein
MPDKANLHEHPIAKEIMTKQLYVLEGTATLQEAIQMMFEKRISSVIIKRADSNEYFIISHNDIVSYLYHLPKDRQITLAEDKISEIMQGPIDILDEEMPLDDVIRYLFSRGYKRAFFGTNGIPSGIITGTDLIMWNNKYFRPARPLLFAILDNQSGIIIGQHVFKENLNKNFNQDIVDLLGGALNSIVAILEEVYSSSGHLREIEKDMFKVLFEPREVITGVLFADAKSITLRHQLHTATNVFCDQFAKEIAILRNSSGCRMLNISAVAKVFRNQT